MKKYIWRPEIMINNLKELGKYILGILLILSLAICPTAWM